MGRSNVTVAAEGRLQDLREVFDACNDLAQRLEDSQAALQREVMRLNDELAEKNRQIARKNRLEILGEMAAGVAHEIRNPLGGIELYAGLIAREARSEPKVADWAHKIQKATRDLSRIVGEILDFTRPIRPQMKPVFVDEAVTAALDLAASRIESAGISVKRLSCGPAPSIRADFNLLQRAFLNVVLNAVEAMPGGGCLTVSVRPASLSGRDAFSVSFADTGVGIPPEDLAKVFDPFFTSKDGGTGLGLAMTARIVSAHQGRLIAANGEPCGAVLTFLLPVDAALSQEMQ